MKKIITFAIVLSMVLSLISVNAYAKSPSGEEMADILSKMEVLHGEGDKGGDYDFYSYLTRAQFAKLSIALSVYKNNVPKKTNTSPFYDVTKDHWAAGYIKVASSNKVISGYPDSTFRPENGVLLEEGVTIVLKLLGYTSEDFGDEWPYGQMGIADNIGLLDNVSCSQGNTMTRLDAITLLYNMLTCNPKGDTNDYIKKLGYELKEDVIIVSSYLQDSGLDMDKVVTSEGTFKVDNGFDYSNVGDRGNILIKNNEKIIGFYTGGQTKEVYAVTGTLGNDIVVAQGGVKKTLDITDDTVAYYNTNKTTYSMLAQKAGIGDKVTVAKDETGRIKYVSLETQKLNGPVTVKSPSSLLSELGINESGISIIKSGNSVSLSSINVNDIVYYSKNLNTVWVYSDKVTGIYEEAYPNQEFPTSVKISGTEYQIESTTALAKLNSAGNCKLGSTITALLGKDGKIADVATSAQASAVYGYLVETGSKQFKQDNQIYSSYYITVVTANGAEMQYAALRDYSNYNCQPVKVTFENNFAKVAVLEKTSLSGVFNAEDYTFAGLKVAKDIGIIDVKDNNTSERGEYKKIYPAALNNVKIANGRVLYCGKNNSGEIDSLILLDATGDCYDYGVIISASEKGGTEYVQDGITKTSRTFFTVKSHTPVKLDIKNGDLSGVSALTFAGKVEKINSQSVICENGKEYAMSPEVKIYYVNSDWDYMLKTVNDILSEASRYSMSAYYDKAPENGGKIRVIIARNK